MAPNGQIIIIKKTGEDGSCFPVLTNSCRIGRGHVCDIRIQREAVSEEHCIIETRKDSQVWIRNLTENVTLINSAPTSKDWVALKHKDVITISDRSFRWEYLRGSKFYSDVGAPCQQNSKSPHKDMEEKRTSIMKNPPDKNIVSDSNCPEEKHLITSTLTPLIGSAAADVNLKSRQSLRTSTSNQLLVFDKVSFVQDSHRDVEKMLNKKEKLRKSFKTPKKYDCLSSISRLHENESCFDKEQLSSPICSLVEREELKLKENFLNEPGNVYMKKYVRETPKTNAVTELSKRRLFRTPRMKVSLGVSPFRKDKNIISCENSLKSQDTISVVKGDLIDFTDTNPEISDKVTSLKITPNSAKKLKLRNTPKSKKKVEFHFSDDDTSRKENVATQSNIISSIIKAPLTNKSDLVKVPISVEFEESGPYSKNDISETQSSASKQCRRSFRKRSLILMPLQKEKVFQLTPNCEKNFAQRVAVGNGWSVTEMRDNTQVKTSQTTPHSAVDLTEKNEILRGYLDGNEINESIMSNTSCSDSYIMHLKTPETPSFEYLDVSQSSGEMMFGKMSVETPMANRANQDSSQDLIFDTRFNTTIELMNTPQLSFQDIQGKKSNKLKGIKRKSLKAEESSWAIRELVTEKLCVNGEEKPRKRRSEMQKLFLGTSVLQNNAVDSPNYADGIKETMQTPHVTDVHCISQKSVKSEQKSVSRMEAIKETTSVLNEESDGIPPSNSSAQVHVYDLHNKTPGMKCLNVKGSSAKARRRRRFDMEKYLMNTPALQKVLKKEVETPNFAETITEMMKTQSMPSVDQLESIISEKIRHNSSWMMEANKDSLPNLEATSEFDELYEVVQHSEAGEMDERQHDQLLQEVNMMSSGMKTPGNMMSTLEKSGLVTSALKKSARNNSGETTNFAGVKEIMQTPRVTMVDNMEFQRSVKSTRKARRSTREDIVGSPAVVKEYSDKDESSSNVQNSICEEDANEVAPGLIEKLTRSAMKTSRNRRSMLEKSTFVTPALQTSTKINSGQSPNITESITEMLKTPSVTMEDNLKPQRSVKSTRKSRFKREDIVDSPKVIKGYSEEDESSDDVQNSIYTTDESEVDANEDAPGLIEEKLTKLSVKTPKNRRSTFEKSISATPARKLLCQSPRLAEGMSEMTESLSVTMVDNLESQRSMNGTRKSRRSTRDVIVDSPAVDMECFEEDESPDDVQNSIYTTDESEVDAIEVAPGLIEEKLTRSAVKTPRNRRSTLEKAASVTPSLKKSTIKNSGESPNFAESIKEILKTPSVTMYDNLKPPRSVKSTRKSRSTREDIVDCQTVIKEYSEEEKPSDDVQQSICTTDESEVDSIEDTPKLMEEKLTESTVKTPRNRKSTEKSILVTPALKKSMHTPSVTMVDNMEFQRSVSGTRKSRRSTRDVIVDSPAVDMECFEEDESPEDVQNSIYTTDESEVDAIEVAPGLIEEKLTRSAVKTPRNRRSTLEKAASVTPSLKKSTIKNSGESPNFAESIKEILKTPSVTMYDNLKPPRSVKSTRKSRSTREDIVDCQTVIKEYSEEEKPSDDVQQSICTTDESEVDSIEDTPKLMEEKLTESTVKTPRNRKSTEKSILVTPALKKSMHTPSVTMVDNMEFQRSVSGTRKSRRSTRDVIVDSPAADMDCFEEDESPDDVQNSIYTTDESEVDAIEVAPGLIEEKLTRSAVKTPRNRRSTLEKAASVTPSLKKSTIRNSGESPNFAESIKEILKTPSVTMYDNLKPPRSVKSTRKSRSTREDIVDCQTVIKEYSEEEKPSDDVQQSICTTDESEVDSFEDTPKLMEEKLTESTVKTPRNRKSTEKSILVTPALKKSMHTPSVTMVDNMEFQRSVSGTRKSRSTRDVIVDSPAVDKECFEEDESPDDVQNSVYTTDESEVDAIEVAPGLIEEKLTRSAVKTPRNRRSTEKAASVTPSLKKSTVKNSGESPNFAESIKEILKTPSVTMYDNLKPPRSVKSTRKSRSTREDIVDCQTVIKEYSEEEKPSDDVQQSICTTDESEVDSIEDTPKLMEEKLTESTVKTPRNWKSTEKSILATPALITSMHTSSVTMVDNMEFQRSVSGTRKSRRSTRDVIVDSPAVDMDCFEEDESPEDVQNSIYTTDESEVDAIEVAPGLIEEKLTRSAVKTPRNRRSTLEKAASVTPSLKKSTIKNSGESPNFAESIKEILKTSSVTMYDNLKPPRSVKSTHKSRSTREDIVDCQTVIKEYSEEEKPSVDVQQSICTTDESEVDSIEDTPKLMEEKLTESTVKTPRNRKSTEKSILVTPASKKSMHTPSVTMVDNMEFQRSVSGTRKSRRSTRDVIVDSPAVDMDCFEEDESPDDVQNSIYTTDESEVDAIEVAPGLIEEKLTRSAVKTPRNRRSTLEKAASVTPSFKKSTIKNSGESPNFAESIKEILKTPSVTMYDNLKPPRSVKSTRKSRSTREDIVDCQTVIKEYSEEEKPSDDVQQSICTTDESEVDSIEDTPKLMEEKLTESTVKTPRNRKSTEKSILVTPALKKSMHTPSVTMVDNMEFQRSVSGTRKSRRSTRDVIVHSPAVDMDCFEEDESPDDVQNSIYTTDESEVDAIEVAPGLIEEKLTRSAVKTPRNRRSTLEKAASVTPSLKKSTIKNSGESPNFAESIKEILKTPSVTMDDNLKPPRSVKSTHKSRSTREDIVDSPTVIKEYSEEDGSSDDVQNSICTTDESEVDANEDALGLMKEKLRRSVVKTQKTRRSTFDKSTSVIPSLKKSMVINSGGSPTLAEGMGEIMQTAGFTPGDLQEFRKLLKSLRKSRRCTIEASKAFPSVLEGSAEVEEISDIVHNSGSYVEVDENEEVDVYSAGSVYNPPSDSCSHIEETCDLMLTPLHNLCDNSVTQKSEKIQHKSQRSPLTFGIGSSSTIEDREVDSIQQAHAIQNVNFTRSGVKIPINDKSLMKLEKTDTESPSSSEDIKVMMQSPHSAAVKSQYESQGSTMKFMEDSSSRNESGVGENQENPLMQDVYLITPGVKRPKKHNRSLMESSLLNSPALLKSVKKYTNQSPNFSEGIKEVMHTPHVTLVDFMESRESGKSRHNSSEPTIEVVENSPSMLEEDFQTHETPEVVQPSSIKPIHVSHSSKAVDSEQIPKSSHSKFKIQNMTTYIQGSPNTSACSYKYISRMKELMTRRSPVSRYSNFEGVKRMFTAKSPDCSYLDVSGLNNLFNLSGSPSGKDSFSHEQQSNVGCSVQTAENILVDKLLVDKVSQPHVILSRLSSQAVEQASKQNEKVVPTKSRYSRRVKSLQKTDVIANDSLKKNNLHSQFKSKENNKSRTKKPLIQNEIEEMPKPKSMRATRRNKDLDITQSISSQQSQAQKNETDHSNIRSSVKSTTSKRVKLAPDVKENSSSGLIVGGNARTKPDSTNMSLPLKDAEISVDNGDCHKSNISIGLKPRRAMLKLSVQFKSPATEGAEEKAKQSSSILGKRTLRKILIRDLNGDDINVMPSKEEKKSSDDQKSNESSAKSRSISPNIVADVKSNPRRKTRSNKMVDLKMQSDEKVVVEEKQNVSVPTRSSQQRKTVSGELEENDSNKKTARRRNKIVDDKKSEESNIEDISISLNVLSDMKSNFRRKTRANKMAESETHSIEKIAVEENQVVPLASRSLRQKKVTSSSEIEENVSTKIITKTKSVGNNVSTNYNSEDFFKSPDIIDNFKPNLRRKTRSKKADELTITSVKTVVFEKSQTKPDESNTEDDSIFSNTVTDVKPNLKRITRTNKMINLDPCTDESLTNENSQDNSVTTKSSLQRKALSSKDRKTSKISEEKDMKTNAIAKENVVNERKTRRTKIETISDDLTTSAARKSDRKRKENDKGKKPAESVVEESEAKKSAVVTEKRSLRKNISVNDVADEKDTSSILSEKRKISNSILDKVDERLNSTNVLNDDNSLQNNDKHTDKSHVKMSKVKRTGLKGNKEVQDSSNLETRALRNKAVVNDNSESIKPNRVVKRKLSDDGIQDDSQNSHKKQNVHVEERFNLRRKTQKTTDENMDVAGKKAKMIQKERPVLRQRKSAR